MKRENPAFLCLTSPLGSLHSLKSLTQNSGNDIRLLILWLLSDFACFLFASERTLVFRISPRSKHVGKTSISRNVLHGLTFAVKISLTSKFVTAKPQQYLSLREEFPSTDNGGSSSLRANCANVG